MLILTRRPGETLVMKTESGELINVTVMGVKANQVRIGVEAPKTVAVNREELHLKKESELMA